MRSSHGDFFVSYQRTFTTLGCPERDLAVVAALVQAHGLDGAELRFLEGTADLPALFARKYSAPAALAAEAARLGLKVVALDTSFKLSDETDEAREALKAFVQWGEALGVRWLRVFDGGKPGDDTARGAMLRSMEWWRKLRAGEGWRSDLMVETHDSLFTAAAIGQFVNAAGGASILWDTHHTWKKGGEDPLVTWAAIKPHVVHVHVKDSVSRPSARHPFTYVRPGEGEFPAAGLLPVLRREFAGFVSLEWERKWHPYLPPLEEALAAAARRNWW